MENNNLTIYNPNSEDITDTKEINTEETQSYPDSSQKDIDSSLKSNGCNSTDNTTNGNNNGSVSNSALSSNPSKHWDTYWEQQNSQQENTQYQPVPTRNLFFKQRLDEQPRDHSPTQAICLMTTVPQNIASRSLGDKHTPTRNSLRHSRMIVMNRHGKVPEKYLPYIIRHYKLVKSMKVITIILGTVLCLLSMLMVLWSPTLKALDFPYWSAVPVLFSGVVGCFFLGFCPRPYPGRRLGCYYHLTKSVSLLTTAASIMSTIVVLTINIIHLVYLLTATCVPHDTLNATCVCSTNSTTNLFNDSYHYEDLTCDEVDYFLKTMIVTVGVINLAAFVLDVLYMCVHWSSRTRYVYAQVPVREGIRTIDDS